LYLKENVHCGIFEELIQLVVLSVSFSYVFHNMVKMKFKFTSLVIVCCELNTQRKVHLKIKTFPTLIVVFKKFVVDIS
jgi:hypothetical protein